MIDKYITWTDHVGTVENVIAKNIGSLYRSKQLLNTSSLKVFIFHIFIHVFTMQTLHGQVHKKTY